MYFHDRSVLSVDVVSAAPPQKKQERINNNLRNCLFGPHFSYVVHTTGMSRDFYAQDLGH